MADLNAIRAECWRQCIQCFGTAYIFEQRAHRLRSNLRLIVFLGIALPASVGAAFAAYGANSGITTLILALASALGIVQLLLSIWSLAAKWDDEFGYALQSQSANRILSEDFRQLASNPPPVNDAEINFKLLMRDSEARTIQDEQHGITDKEKRMGMRAGLRHVGQACAKCKEVPASMEPTKCPVCGQF